MSQTLAVEVSVALLKGQNPQLWWGSQAPTSYAMAFPSHTRTFITEWPRIFTWRALLACFVTFFQVWFLLECIAKAVNGVVRHCKLQRSFGMGKEGDSQPVWDSSWYVFFKNLAGAQWMTPGEGYPLSRPCGLMAQGTMVSVWGFTHSSNNYLFNSVWSGWKLPRIAKRPPTIVP